MSTARNPVSRSARPSRRRAVTVAAPICSRWRGSASWSVQAIARSASVTRKKTRKTASSTMVAVDAIADTTMDRAPETQSLTPSITSVTREASGALISPTSRSRSRRSIPASSARRTSSAAGTKAMTMTASAATPMPIAASVTRPATLTREPPPARSRSASGSKAAVTTAASTTDATTVPRTAVPASTTRPNATTTSRRHPRLADWASQSGTLGCDSGGWSTVRVRLLVSVIGPGAAASGKDARWRGACRGEPARSRGVACHPDRTIAGLGVGRRRAAAAADTGGPPCAVR